jgi:hypothetical protein
VYFIRSSFAWRANDEDVCTAWEAFFAAGLCGGISATGLFVTFCNETKPVVAIESRESRMMALDLEPIDHWLIEHD